MNILSTEDFTVQTRMDKVLALSDIGRIPHKIQTSFHNFTADQYKNRVVHYECWRHFVLACQMLCQSSLTG